MCAVAAGHVHRHDHVRCLLQLQDADGRTPLMLAANYGHAAALERLLVAAGADARRLLPDVRPALLAVKDRFGFTALAIAQRYQHEEAARVLKDAASPN
jgi:ankyrin repeat protein